MRTLAPTHIGPPPQPRHDAQMHPLDGIVRLPSDGFCGAQTVTRGEWLALHADTYLTAERGASAAGPNSPPATGGCPALGDQAHEDAPALLAPAGGETETPRRSR